MKEKGKEKGRRRKGKGRKGGKEGKKGNRYETLILIWLMFIHIPPSTLTEIAGSGWNFSHNCNAKGSIMQVLRRTVPTLVHPALAS